MVAVFCKTKEEFQEIRYSPKKDLVWVQEESDLHGLVFTGILESLDWYFDNPVGLKAYDELLARQPELGS